MSRTIVGTFMYTTLRVVMSEPSDPRTATRSPARKWMLLPYSSAIVVTRISGPFVSIMIGMAGLTLCTISTMRVAPLLGHMGRIDADHVHPRIEKLLHELLRAAEIRHGRNDLRFFHSIHRKYRYFVFLSIVRILARPSRGAAPPRPLRRKSYRFPQPPSRASAPRRWSPARNP